MKSDVFEKAIKWTQKRGFSNIKANNSDFDSPVAFTFQNKEGSVIPDITGTLNGNKSYIEIAQKEEDKHALISKWKLLCTLAERKGGKLYILAARGQKTFADNIVKDHNLHYARVVSI